MRIKQSENFVR